MMKYLAILLLFISFKVAAMPPIWMIEKYGHVFHVDKNVYSVDVDWYDGHWYGIWTDSFHISKSEIKYKQYYIDASDKGVLYNWWSAFFWVNSNGNVLANRTNYPTITGGDTLYIPPFQTAGVGYRSQSYKNLYCNQVAPTQAQMIHIVWQTGAFIAPSSSSIQANFIDSLYGVEIRGCNQNDHIDPFFWAYGATGYLKYVLFNRDTLRGTNGFFGSFNPTLTLPAFTGDSTNCFFHVEWRNCLWDSVIGANSGETALWIGTVTSTKNQFWVYPKVDSCTFNHYSSAANPASYIHAECCFGFDIGYNHFANLGIAAHPVGHAASSFTNASQIYYHNNTSDTLFGDDWRNEGCGQIPGWNTALSIGNPNGRSLAANCITRRKRKYAFIETRTDPGDVTTLSPFYASRTCPELYNITLFRMGAGAGNQYYNPSLVDCYENDSLFAKNCNDIGPLTDTVWTYCTGQGCNALITTPNGAVTVWDTAKNYFDSTFVLSGLADTTFFFAKIGGKLYGAGVNPPSYITIDYYGRSRRRNTNVVDIGAPESFQGLIGPIPVGSKPHYHS